MKLIGAKVGPYTDNNDGHKSSRTPRVECQVYERHQTFFPSIVKLFISFSYFELRFHFRDGIKTLKEKCFNSEIFRRVHDVMVFIAMMFLLKVKPRILTEWAPDCEESCGYYKLPLCCG